MKKVGRLKLIKNSVKVYNHLCQDCKRKILKNPKINISEYCDQCKLVIEKYLGGMIK